MSLEEPNVPYGGTTGERLKAFAVNAETRQRIEAALARYWEVGAYGFLLLSAVILRFYQLGARAMHHDESLHGYFGYGFTKGLRNVFTPDTANVDGYSHVPFMHGPFQFIGNGFMMWIFGEPFFDVGEMQARLMAAVLGSAMVVAPFLLRKQLGTFGALAVALLICFSPTLTYYSRFTREDIYTAFWTLGIVIFAWRYMTTQKNSQLYWLAGFMAGLFLTKETSYMTVGGIIFFFEFLWSQHVAHKIRAKSPSMSDIQFTLLSIALLPTAWILAFGWVFLEDWRKKYDLDELPPEANVLIVMASLALPMYAAAVQEIPVLFDREWRIRNEEGINHHIARQEWTVAMVSIFGLLGLGTAIGLIWRPKVWGIAAGIFWVFIFLFSTTFFTNMGGPGFLGIHFRPDGLFSVVWGSLDYWLSQQDVRRGNQPDYYYFITIPTYEFLPLILAAVGGLYYMIRGNLRNVAIIAAAAVAIIILLVLPHGPGILACEVPVGENPGNLCPEGDARNGVSTFHVILPFSIAMLGVISFKTDHFTRFLMFWLVLTAFALTVAGEKMPWLNVHIALPLCVLAGKFVGDMINRNDLRDDLPSWERLAPYAYAAVASALSIVVFVIVGPLSIASVGGWLLAIVAGIAVYWAFTSYSPRTALQVAFVGFVAAASIFTIRATVLSSWGHPDDPDLYKGSVASRDHGEVPREMLVYTQTSGDIPALMKEVERAARESGLGKSIPIVVDSGDGFTWPWAWYLRDYKSIDYRALGSGTRFTPPPGAILFITRGAEASVDLAAAQYGEPIPYQHRSWFPEEYRGTGGVYSTHNFFGDLVNFDQIGRWWNYWVRREPPAEIGHVDGLAFFPSSFDVSPIPPAETVRQEGNQLVIGRTGVRQGELSAPANVAFDADGNIYVADSGNDRISKYTSEGVFASAFGGFGGSVAMEEPWSMVIADDGKVFVANTWHHKVMRLNADGTLDHEWGAGCTTLPDCDEFQLYGPRDIALTSDGNVVITDTGNDRVIMYTQDGDFVRVADADAIGVDEPIGIEVSAEGEIFVGDMFNRRIVVLDNDLNIVREIPVSTWGSSNVPDKPYFALLDEGRIIVADPYPLESLPGEGTPLPPADHAPRLLVLDPDGTVLTTYELPVTDGAGQARPIGVATDGTSVLVSDSGGNVVRKIPIEEILP